MKAAFATLIIFIFSFTMVARMTICVENIPAYFMPLLDDIYLVGSCNDWNPSSSEHLFQEGGGNCQIGISRTLGKVIEFKFTRGDRTSVETNKEGSFLSDRTLVFEDQGEFSFGLESFSYCGCIHLGWSTIGFNSG